MKYFFKLYLFERIYVNVFLEKINLVRVRKILNYSKITVIIERTE